MSPLQSLVPVLRKWSELHERYWQHNGDDCAFWHSEATNTALLAAAAWQLRGMGIVEYLDPRRGKERNGRIDLWLRTGGRRPVEFIIEAKQQVFLPRDPGLQKKLKANLQAALDDADTCVAPKHEQRVGILFAFPKVDHALPTREQGAQWALFDSTVRTLHQEGIADCAICCDARRAKLAFPSRGKRYSAPGMFLLAKALE